MDDDDQFIRSTCLEEDMLHVREADVNPGALRGGEPDTIMVNLKPSNCLSTAHIGSDDETVEDFFPNRLCLNELFKLNIVVLVLLLNFLRFSLLHALFDLLGSHCKSIVGASRWGLHGQRLHEDVVGIWHLWVLHGWAVSDIEIDPEESPLTFLLVRDTLDSADVEWNESGR